MASLASRIPTLRRPISTRIPRFFSFTEGVSLSSEMETLSRGTETTRAGEEHREEEREEERVEVVRRTLASEGEAHHPCCSGGCTSASCTAEKPRDSQRKPEPRPC
ncbi:Hypothetical protein FKW44_023084 [Caligus rogercresseyi]|uniref:Uncharacterized protein n=1 Tax=Caligus rogercresseyi TaxID=217165 RepID=A0A7T8JTW7_CALRO|nr:Hypothetical protein FKW44_023084 [Caligus rogercresseyi]